MPSPALTAALESLIESAAPPGSRVGGVSLAPLYRDAASGEVCVMLGRERHGHSKGRLNFIGGRTGDKHTLADTLLEEVRSHLFFLFLLQHLVPAVQI
jgi:hypothetical protein